MGSDVAKFCLFLTNLFNKFRKVLTKPIRSRSRFIYKLLNEQLFLDIT